MKSFKETINRIPCVFAGSRSRNATLQVLNHEATSSCALRFLSYHGRRQALSLTRLINTSTVLIGWYELLHEFLFPPPACLNLLIVSYRRSLRFAWPCSRYSHVKALGVRTKTCFISLLFLCLHFNLVIVLFLPSFFRSRLRCLKVLKFQFKNNKNIFIFKRIPVYVLYNWIGL